MRPADIEAIEISQAETGRGVGQVRTAAGAVAQRPFFIGVLVALHLVMLLFSIRSAHLHPEGFDDATRFQQVATSVGRPWRDVPVEYAPIETLVLRAIHGSTIVQTGIRVAILAFIADLATAAAIAWGWGRRAAARYLVLGLPLLPFIYLRFDPIPTALAVGAVALAARNKQRAAGATLASAVLTKVWPIVLAPLWLVQHRPRAMAWFLCLLAAGAGVWVWYGGVGAPSQVLTFRHAGGWEIEGSVGVVVWLVTGGPAFAQSGAIRVGDAPSWASALLATVLAVTLALVWIRARRWRGPLEGVPALAAVSALVVLSPVFSIQYLWWLPPWAAIAGTERKDRGFVSMTAIAAILTTVEADTLFWGYPRTTGVRATIGALIVVARNVLCAAIVVRYLLASRRGPTSQT